MLQHLTYTQLRGQGRRTLLDVPILLYVFWTGVLASAERCGKIPAKLIVASVQNAFRVKKLKLRAVYPNGVITHRPSWMTVGSMYNAIRRVSDGRITKEKSGKKVEDDE